MKIQPIFVAALALLTLAAFNPVADAACAGEATYQACLNTENGAITQCGQDYACLCQKYKDRGSCYLQCPDDPQAQADASSNSGLVTTYCSAASNIASYSSAAAAAASSTGGSSSNAQPTKGSTTSSGSATPSSSNAPSNSTKSNSATTANNPMDYAKFLLVAPAVAVVISLM